jgi:hypothetical protein
MRYIIRDVLWLTVVVAMACAWWMDRSSLNTARKSAVNAEAEAQAGKEETLMAIVELYDAIHRRNLTTAQDFGKKIEVYGPLNR